MDRITVKGSTSYDVIIANGILGRVGELLHLDIGGKKALIVTDENVAPLYLNTVADSLVAYGYEVLTLSLEPGDQTKSINSYVDIIGILAENEFSSSDVCVALGGGMIGDLTGFVGSTYKRGMCIAQIPTSLLAAVDASVGGKTAVNLPSGKNQVGTIHNPSIVICDPLTMRTLSGPAMQEGYAEILKYGILAGEDIIDALRLAVNTGDYSKVIAMSVTIKRDVVEADEKDKGVRQYLNFGHLIGHAIEASSGYRVSHGQAVAEGMALEARCAALSGYTEMTAYTEISTLLEEFGFDISQIYSSDILTPFIKADKRIRNEEIRIIVPHSVGNCTSINLPISKLYSYINKGL